MATGNNLNYVQIPGSRDFHECQSIQFHRTADQDQEFRIVGDARVNIERTGLRKRAAPQNVAIASE